MDLDTEISVPRQKWQKYGRCNSLTAAQADYLLFGNKAQLREAKWFCSHCPIRNLCLQDAVTNVMDGFVAGTTPEERANIANQQYLDRLVADPTETAAKIKRLADLEQELATLGFQ